MADRDPGAGRYFIYRPPPVEISPTVHPWPSPRRRLHRTPWLAGAPLRPRSRVPPSLPPCGLSPRRHPLCRKEAATSRVRQLLLARQVHPERQTRESCSEVGTIEGYAGEPSAREQTEGSEAGGSTAPVCRSGTKMDLSLGASSSSHGGTGASSLGELATCATDARHRTPCAQPASSELQRATSPPPPRRPVGDGEDWAFRLRR